MKKGATRRRAGSERPICSCNSRYGGGLIGTNEACAKETTDLAIADLPTLPVPTGDPNALVAKVGDAVDFDAWRVIDALELEQGKARNKVRHKLTSIAGMLEAAKKL